MARLTILIFILVIIHLLPNALSMFDAVTEDGSHGEQKFEYDEYGLQQPNPRISQGPKCGNIFLENMVDFTFKSKVRGREVKMLIAPEADGPNIYTGYVGKGIRKKKFLVHNCVTVKLAETAIISRIVNKPRKFTHIINIRDYGETHDGGNGKSNYANTNHVTLMEFTHPLQKTGNLNQQEFAKEIEKYARALQELHEIGLVHLGIKRANFRYAVNGVDGPDTVKLFNFDKTLMLSKGQTKILIPASMHPPWDYYFHGPEFKNGKEPVVSKKTDIWSLGMLVYETYIDQNYSSMPEDLRKTLLQRAGAIYRGFTWAQRRKAFSPTADWLKTSIENAFSLKIFLAIRNENPHMFLLLQDILQPDPDMRMNANGVLEFLDGICKPAQFADDSYKQPHTAQILPGMSEAELAKILQADAILAPLLELMNRGTAKYQQAIKKIQGLPQCPQE